MANTLLGKATIIPRGAYSAETEYYRLNLVTDSGNSYLYINPTPSTDVPLTDTTHWQQIAEKGLKGDPFEYEDFTSEQLALLVGDPTDSMTEANQIWEVE